MKELSIEQKAKRYDEILARAVGANLPYYNDAIMSKVKEFVEYLLPELKESEGEKIKSAAIEFVRQNKSFNYCLGISKEEVIAWLEKQGNNINCIYDKELSKLLHVVICRYINDPNISYSERENVSKKILPYVELLEKQGEQNLIMAKSPQLGERKPVWSEEDEDNFKTLVGILNERMNSCDKGTMTYNVYKKIQDWLKSLKERYTWKPSDEQLEALIYVVNLMASSESPTENDYYYNVFKDLIKQLKKLMEE